MVSSASAQIEAVAGDQLRTKTGRPDYGKVSRSTAGAREWASSLTLSFLYAEVGAILIGVVAAWIIGCCLVGAEQHGAHFEKGKVAFEIGGGRDEMEERECTFPFGSQGIPLDTLTCLLGVGDSRGAEAHHRARPREGGQLPADAPRDDQPYGQLAFQAVVLRLSLSPIRSPSGNLFCAESGAVLYTNCKRDVTPSSRSCCSRRE